MNQDALGLARIDLSRSVVAGASAALALAALLRFGLTGQGALVAATFVVLVVLSAVDLRERRLPNAIVLPATAATFLAQALIADERLAEYALGAALAGGALLIAALMNPGGLGMGDVKLALLLGALLGSSVLPALMVGFLLIVPVSAVLFWRHGAAARRATVPLGPFLATGAVAVLLAGGPGA